MAAAEGLLREVLTRNSNKIHAQNLKSNAFHRISLSELTWYSRHAYSGIACDANCMCNFIRGFSISLCPSGRISAGFRRQVGKYTYKIGVNFAIFGRRHYYCQGTSDIEGRDASLIGRNFFPCKYFFANPKIKIIRIIEINKLVAIKLRSYQPQYEISEMFNLF